MQLPKVELPKIDLPKAATNAVKTLAIPTIAGAGAVALATQLPKIAPSKIELPKISLPTVDLPKIAGDVFNLPVSVASSALAAPIAIGDSVVKGITKAVLPSVVLPTIELPNDPISAVSGGIDAVINARERSYEQGVNRIASGNTAQAGIGGAQWAGTAAADILLPLDLVNVGNKLVTGRGGELDTWDYVGAAVDVGTIILGAVTGGAGYGVSRGLLKGGKMIKPMGLLNAFEAAKSAGKSTRIATKMSGVVGGFKPTVRSFNVIEKAPKFNFNLKSKLSALQIRKGSVLGKTGESTVKIGKGFDSFKTTEPVFESGIKAGNTAGTFKGIDSFKTTEPAFESGIRGASSGGLLGKALTGAGLLGLGGIGAMALFGGDAGLTQDDGSGGAVSGGGGYDDAYAQQLEEYLAALEEQVQGNQEYIEALEQYMTELEAAFQNGQISQEDYDALMQEAMAEYADATGQYIAPPWGEGTPYDYIEGPAQEVTRAADGVPVLGDVLEWFRHQGLALPGLIVVGGVIIVGGAYGYKAITGKKIKVPGLTTRRSSHGKKSGKRKAAGAA